MRRAIRKVLVANRGEIAVRIIRTARVLGLQTAAVYADPDRGALYTECADECIPLEGSTPRDTYLSADKLLAAARSSGADALHPGYGFLAESEVLARACEAAGILFIGPPADVLRVSGHKLHARERVEAAGVPVLPVLAGTPEALPARVAELEPPLLVKAALGGGGRGMRIVEDPAQLAPALAAAAREAESAFGEREVYVERFLPHARHVEVQVLADEGGNVLALGERECSIQRRNQKLIEESPAPDLPPELRRTLAADAVRAARALGYRNAGTVEFLLETDPGGRPLRHYFLELNARIQVEHPVTEMVTGEDLVARQFELALGARLAADPPPLEPRGHAIECRIVAETPPAFVPSSGRIEVLRLPGGPGIRADTGYREGDSVPVEFDSLVAKCVAWAPDRTRALKRMRAALEELAVLGIDTSAGILADVIEHPLFQAGRATTAFLEREFSGWAPPQPPAWVEAVARELRKRSPLRKVETRASAEAEGPWASLSRWGREAGR